MSRANIPVAPYLFQNNGDMNASAPDGEVVAPGCSHITTGITISEHASLTFAAAIVASGRKSSSDVTGVMIEAAEYTREWLKEFAR